MGDMFDVIYDFLKLCRFVGSLFVAVLRELCRLQG